MRGRIVLEVWYRGKWKLSRRGPEFEFKTPACMQLFWNDVLADIKRKE
jgi:hypothetical protein